VEHTTIETTFKTVEQYIMKDLMNWKTSTAELIAQRMEKYSKMGEYKGKSLQLSLIRALPFRFFGYKQKNSYL
jgi:hypothetical protein